MSQPTVIESGPFYWYLSYVQPTGRVWYNALFLVGQGDEPKPGQAQKCLGPRRYSHKNGWLRREAIHLTIPRWVRAWGTVPEARECRLPGFYVRRLQLTATGIRTNTTRSKLWPTKPTEVCPSRATTRLVLVYYHYCYAVPSYVSSICVLYRHICIIHAHACVQICIFISRWCYFIETSPNNILPLPHTNQNQRLMKYSWKKKIPLSDITPF